MGGLLTGLLLQQAGWRVDIYERTGSELSSRGAGIVTHQILFDVLKRARVVAQPEVLGIAVPGRRVFGAAGAVANELPLPQVLTSWGRLYALLRAALPDDHYHGGTELQRIEETEHAVRTHFTDGSHAEADLVVGADGLFSTVRRQFLPEVQPKYAGYVAWRGLVDEAELSTRTRENLFNWFSFSLPPGEQMLGYPVAGIDEAVAPGKRRFNFVWYRPVDADRGLPNLLTDTDGKRHGLSIPPTKIRPEVTARMRADAERLLAPQFAEVVRLTKQPFLQAIVDLETPHLRLGRRVAILGDAAFVARPHVGMGVTKAAADTAALAAALETSPDDMDAALRSFESIRLPEGAAVVGRARDLGAYMQAQLLTDQERATAEAYRSPEAVMVETAVATGFAA